MRRGDPGYWDWRANTGKPKKLKSPKELWKLACEYFKMVDETPFQNEDFIKGGDMAGTKVYLNGMKPYQWKGFSAFLFERCYLVKLDDYRANKDNRYPEFADILSRIEDIIYSQKYEGAAVGAFPANLITRDLGITEKIQQQTQMVEQPLFPDSD